MAASDARRPRHVGEQRGVIGLGTRVEPGAIVPRQRAQRLLRLARERQDARRARGGPLAHRRGGRHRQRPRNRLRQAGGAFAGAVGRRIALQQHVGVGARPAEAAHAGARRAVGNARPRGGRRGDLQRQVVPVHLRVGRAEVEVPGDLPPVDGQHRLDDAGDAGGRLQMADVGLDRADQQRVVGIASPAVGRPGRLHLDGIADLGAGAVRLDVVDPGRRDAGGAQRRLDHLLLRRPARHGQPRAGAVLVEGRAADHAPDAVALRFRLREPLQHHDAAAFAAHVAVGGGVEGGAAPVRREHPGVGAHLQQPAGEDGVDTAGEREVRLAPLQARGRLVDRHQRGRAGGIQRQCRPFQPEREGDPPDGGVEGGAGDGVEVGRGLCDVADVEDQAAVLVVADARVDAGAAALEAIRVHARVLERAPAGLQHQPLLRVQHLRLHRRDAEEGGVEVLEIVQVGAEAACPHLPRSIGEEQSHAPDSGAGLAFRHGAPALVQQAPEGGEIVRAGKAAGHADDRDRRVVAGSERPLPFRFARRLSTGIVGDVSFHHRPIPFSGRPVRAPPRPSRLCGIALGVGRATIQRASAWRHAIEACPTLGAAAKAHTIGRLTARRGSLAA